MYLFRSRYHAGGSYLRCRTAVAISLLLTILWSNIAAAGQNIVVITSSALPAYQRAAKALERQMALNGMSSSFTTDFWSLEEAKAVAATVNKRQDAVFVAIGSAAADFAVHHFVDSVVICSFITRNAFETIGADLPASNTVSAIFIDQPIERLIKMSSLLKKDQTPIKIGMLSQNTLPVQSIVSKAAARGLNIEINTRTLSLTENPLKQIEPIMKNSDVFIIRPNTSLFNRLVAKLVLQLSMRYKTPVIGFSEKYAKAGALLSLYASPENIGQDAAKLLTEWLLSPQNSLPVARDGSEFTLVINHRIARKLAMRLDDEQLKAALLKMEGQQH